MGLGLLSALAISMAPSPSALISVGAEIVRMAFRMGRYVASTAQAIEQSSESKLETWAYVAPGLTEDTARPILQTYNEVGC
jgi:hypothetical protein